VERVEKRQYEIAVVRASEEVVGQVSALFSAEDDPRERDLFDWQYLGPEGGAYVGLAYPDGDRTALPAALYPTFPVPMRVRGCGVIATQSFDTLTGAAHRGQGLFVKLGLAVYEQLRLDGVELVYGFPNDAVLPGRRDRLNWTIMDPVPFWARPVGTRYAQIKARRRTPELIPAADESVTVPDDIDELFGAVADARYIGVERNHRYLSWRLGRPGARYRTYSSSVAGATVGFGATAVALKHGACVGYIMELMVSPQHRPSGSELLAQMTTDLKRAGADLILSWLPPHQDLGRMMLRHGYLPLPERLRPVRFHFGAVSLRPGLDVGPRSSWYLSYLDSDTV